MALFKRNDLKDKGLTDEQVDFILNEGNRALASDYVLRSRVQGQIDQALQNAPKPTAPTESEEYKALMQQHQQISRERDMLRAIGGEDFAQVKPKFREQVFGMLDQAEGAKPLAEQLQGVREKYEEYFTPADSAPQVKPSFGAATTGGMPTGKTSQPQEFLTAWGYDKKE